MSYRLPVVRPQRSLLLLTALLTSLVLLFSTASTASALPANFYGVDLAQDSFGNEADWDALQYSGAKMIHMQFNWYTMVNGGGWANTYDRYVEMAAKHGRDILAYLYGRKNSSTEYYTEGGASSWAEYEAVFVKEAVQRYGYNGSFWTNHPNVPYRPIGVWEVWNEPNFNTNSPGGTANGATYAKFLRATSEALTNYQHAISSANPVVLFAGIYQPDRGIDLATYLKQAKEANVQVSSYFDGLGLHPYGFGPEGQPATNEAAKLQSVKDNVNAARSALTAMCASCGGKSIWITEVGWGLWPIQNEHRTVSDAEQASLLTSTYNWLKEVSDSKNIQHVAWYLYKDVTQGEKWDRWAGLRRENGSARPAWCAYAAITGSQCVTPTRWYSENISGNMTGDPAITALAPGHLNLAGKGSDNALYLRTWLFGAPWSQWSTVASGTGAMSSGPSVASWGPNRLDVVARAPGNSIYHWWWDGSWHWENIAGNMTGDPAIVAMSPGHLELVAKGSDNALYYRSWYQGTGWTEWSPVASGTGAVASGPAAASWGSGRLDMVARSTSNSIYHWWWDGSWHWEDIAGSMTADPAIAAVGPGHRLSLVAKGSDNVLYYRSMSEGSGWSEWVGVHGSGTGEVSSAPGAASWGSPRLDVVARATNNSINHWFWDGSTWTGENIAGNMTLDPAIVAVGPGHHVDLVARGSDKALYYRSWYEGSGWSEWGPVAGGTGEVASSPAAASWGSGRLDIVARTPSNTVKHWFWNGSSWNSETLSGTIVEDPVIQAVSPGHLDLVAKKSDNALYYRSWKEGSGWTEWAPVAGGTGAVTSGPGVASWGSGRLDVVARAAGDIVKHWYWNGSSWQTESIGGLPGNSTSDPVIQAVSPGHLNLIVKGTNNALSYRSWHEGSGWTGWGPVSGGTGEVSSSPEAAAWGSGRLDVVARAADNSINHWWWVP